MAELEGAVADASKDRVVGTTSINPKLELCIAGLLDDTVNDSVRILDFGLRSWMGPSLVMLTMEEQTTLMSSSRQPARFLHFSRWPFKSCRVIHSTTWSNSGLLNRTVCFLSTFAKMVRIDFTLPSAPT